MPPEGLLMLCSCTYKTTERAFAIFTLAILTLPQFIEDYLARDLPKPTLGEVTKALSARYKELSPEEQEPYIKRSQDELARYNQAVKEYKESGIHLYSLHSLLILCNLGKKDEWEKNHPAHAHDEPEKKAKKDPDAPTKPRTEYIFFLTENREKVCFVTYISANLFFFQCNPYPYFLDHNPVNCRR